nr:hypothetical protein [Corynebacterium sp. UBA5992]
MSTLARCPWTFQPLEEGATVSPYTHRELLPGWADSVTHCIAMAGARASGKSLYTAVMVKQLQLLANHHKVSVLAADESTEERFRENYEIPLFEEMKIMGATPSAQSDQAYQRDPLIFDLGQWPDAEGRLRTNYLVFRDVAGEDLENLPEDRSSLDFFKFADLVIFLFDPLRVPQVQTYLKGIVATQGELGASPLDVLRNLLILVGEDAPPLAVTVSKFDTLQKLELVSGTEWAKIMGNHGAAFRRDTGWNFSFDDAQILDLEVESLLLLMQADDLVNTVHRIGKREEGAFQYFAVSALGESPQGEELSRSGIAPFRVLDPIRWLLSSRGVMWSDVA